MYAEEIEATLHGHPAVAEGAVEPTLDELQEFCRETLAGDKVPRTVVVVDEVRRTPAGKADYRWAKTAAGAVSA